MISTSFVWENSKEYNESERKCHWVRKTYENVNEMKKAQTSDSIYFYKFCFNVSLYQAKLMKIMHLPQYGFFLGFWKSKPKPCIANKVYINKREGLRQDERVKRKCKSVNVLLKNYSKEDICTKAKVVYMTCNLFENKFEIY